MSQKTLVMIGLTIGSFIGSYIPVIFGSSAFSYSSVIMGAVGGCIGIYIGYKMGEGM